MFVDWRFVEEIIHIEIWTSIKKIDMWGSYTTKYINENSNRSSQKENKIILKYLFVYK